MAIIIPSKNTYDRHDPKVRDNVIERIEVGSVEIKNTVETYVPLDTATNNLQYVSNIAEKTKDGGTTDYQSVEDTLYHFGGIYVQEKIKYATVSVYFSKYYLDYYIAKVYDHKNADGTPNIEVYADYIRTKKLASGRVSLVGTEQYSVSNYSVGDNIEKPILQKGQFDTIAKGKYKLPNNVTLEKEIEITSPEDVLTEDVIYDEEKKEYHFNCTVIIGKEILRLGGYNTTPQERFFDSDFGELETQYAQSVSLAFKGDKINIDFTDNTFYINGETQKKVHSIEGNELIQDKNYCYIDSYRIKLRLSSDKKTITISLGKSYPFNIVYSTNVKLYFGDISYINTNIIAEFEKGETEKTVALYNGSSPVTDVSFSGSKLKAPALEKMYSETQTQYANGKETATIRCSIGDYYDENGKKCISTNFIQEGILPNEYQEVEYIESTGTQYIDTGVIGESGISSKAKVMWREQSSDSALLGSRKNNDRFYLLYQYPLLSWNIGYGENFNAGKFDLNVVYTVETFLENGVQSISIDDNVIYKNSIEKEIKTDCSIYLFDINKNGFPSGYKAKARIYSLTMKKNETIIRDFIPCYRKSDGLVGLWDKVTNKFYTNDGAGLFLKGNNAQTVKPISTKLKMSFDIGDIVIPKVFGVDGNDRPMSLYKNGNAKKFQVLGKKMFYDGAVWQELSLQEV